jgi:beta-xylosidase
VTIDVQAIPLWHDSTASTHERVDALIAAMSIREKVAQLYGVWVGAGSDGGEVAPHQNDMADTIDLDELLPDGLGQLTRSFGTAPVDAALGALSLAKTQERIVASNAFGIPAIAHEECLAGFATWGATAYPVPLAWGATFNPSLVRTMAERIGSDMASVGIHQGLAPVLDVVRDARWGRVEETIGEDPFLVGTIGSAYVAGLESAGIIATLKHFAGYSASAGSRNLAPVSMGPRELADVILPPFEMALREGGARSVMNAYTNVDGIPSAADPRLLTDLLRDRWGFAGTVVADYFTVGFLKTLHGIAETWGDAAVAALTAGIDVELPTVKTYREPLLALLATGAADEAIVDRALRRVLAQKVELGLLDPGWSPIPPALAGPTSTNGETPSDAVRGTIDLDSPGNRALARSVAEQSLVLLTNNGALPLVAPHRIAVIGPNADEPYAVLGCYSFPAHVGAHHPDTPIGIELPTLLDSIRREFPASDIVYARGTTVDGGESDEFDEAIDSARGADVVILALGDRSGLFGRGTSGEGCDAASLRLPGAQQDLLDAILSTGVPVVATVLSGRPYALGRAVADAAAIIQAFFPGEEGMPAIAGILSGRVNPSGRLPVSIPASPETSPTSYLVSTLGRKSGVSNIDPTPAFWFGHGIGYSPFEWSNAAEVAESFEDEISLSVTVTNTGSRDGADVVQLYLHDPVASVVGPVQRLIGFARVDLAAQAAATVTFTVPADLASFTGRDGERIVEPGELVFGFGRSAGDLVIEHRVKLAGSVREIGYDRRLRPIVTIDPH